MLGYYENLRGTQRLMICLSFWSAKEVSLPSWVSKIGRGWGRVSYVYLRGLLTHKFQEAFY